MLDGKPPFRKFCVPYQGGRAPRSNLQIECLITGGDTSLSRAYARELIALQPYVLFVMTNRAMVAMHAELSNIPTVFAMG